MGYHTEIYTMRKCNAGTSILTIYPMPSQMQRTLDEVTVNNKVIYLK